MFSNEFYSNIHQIPPPEIEIVWGFVSQTKLGPFRCHMFDRIERALYDPVSAVHARLWQSRFIPNDCKTGTTRTFSDSMAINHSISS